MTRKIRLVVNADDFGMSGAISRGVIRAHRDGIVTSCSVLGNCDDLRAAAQMLLDAPGLGVGLHLAMSGGAPVCLPSQVPSLVLTDGRFPRNWLSVLARAGGIRIQDLEREFGAQVARAREAGLPIDHLDTHEHLGHMPVVNKAIRAVALRHGIRGIRSSSEAPALRWLISPRRGVLAAALWAVTSVAGQPGNIGSTARSWGVFDACRLSEHVLVRRLERLGPGDHEIMCHPSEPDDNRQEPAFRWRPVEVQALTSVAVRRVIAARQIRLCRWTDLFE